MKIGIVQFMDCGHFLPGHPHCGKPHGHTYKVEMSIEGPTVRGMVMDFSEAKQHLKAVMAELDHITLNALMDFPSCEHICEYMNVRLRGRIRLPFTLRIWEGEGKWAEIGPEEPAVMPPAPQGTAAAEPSCARPVPARNS